MQVVKSLLVVFALLAGAATLSFCTFAGDVISTAATDMSPDNLLKRYEWFKESAAQLSKKKQDVEIAKADLASLADSYGDNALEWPADVRQERSQMRAELRGIIGSYNRLAGEYNAAMAKINYKFTNVGSLPAGAEEVLNREVAPLETVGY